MSQWIAFRFMLKNPYRSIQKDSIVEINGDDYVIKRIDRIILLDESVNESGAVQIQAMGIKVELIGGTQR